MTQVKCPKSAMLDTSFFIRLGMGDAEPEPSRNAREWLKLLVEHSATLYVSTIAQAEVSKVEVFLTADSESEKIYGAFPKDKVHFKLVDIRNTSPNTYLGLLPFVP